MRKVLLTGVAMALTGGSALAADLPYTKAPPPVYAPPPPVYSWTGFYVGLNAGGTWSDNANAYLSSAPGPCNVAFGGCTASPNTSVVLAAVATGPLAGGGSGAFLGGGQIGYNFQFNPSFVVGLEADIQGVAGSSGNLSGGNVVKNPNFIDIFTEATAGARSLDYIGTVRGRIGWLLTPTLLVYGSGGLAYGGVNLSVSTTGGVPNALAPVVPWFGSGVYSDTRVGWTAGGGLEWMFMPNWSAKVEYLYYDLGAATTAVSALAKSCNVVPGACESIAQPTVSTRFNGHIVRAGVNYHFNWGAPAPVYAKY